MTNDEALKTMAANLHQETMRDKIDTAARMGFSQWCYEWGYSPDQITAHTHYSAARALGE